MTRLADLNALIVEKIADADRDAYETQDLIACLVAGIGLAVAVAANGRPRPASDLCEMASAALFTATTTQAARLAADGERA